MMDALWLRLVEAAQTLIWTSVLFGGLGLVVRRSRGFRRLRRQWPEVRLNLIYWAVDAAVVLPVTVLLIDLTARAVQAGPHLSVSIYDGWPVWAAVLLALAISDFVGYWRHRLMHTAALWPAHVIHHSDRSITWTTLMRFHPINRFVNVILNAAALALLGLPPVAILGAAIVRTAYGYFVHADLPWRFGPLEAVFVSPVMHKWHHCRDEALSGRNFATVFALWDWMFGTLLIPDRRAPALGVHENLPRGWLGQTLHPFRVWLTPRRASPTARAAG